MPSSGTSNFNRRGIMKKSILIVLISILLSYPISLMGADYETPHEFKAGDTISADMMNELFEYIKLSKKKLTSDDLVGTWQCQATIVGDGSVPSGWTDGIDSLYHYWEGTIIFQNDNDGTYSYSTTSPNPYYKTDTGTASEKYYVINNIMYFVYERGSSSSAKGAYYVSSISNSAILLQRGPGVSDYGPGRLICNKQNLVPNTPSSLTYANSSSSITLTWTDNQTEAVTGYKVIRKTVVTDDFTTVSTITDNTTRTYADTDVSTGSYWYRVRAYNSNGDGTPSKVVKSEFP
jgi:hypothetical protein